jgi:uncharacterized protein (DUF362 family)
MVGTNDLMWENMMDQNVIIEVFSSYDVSVERCMAAGGAAELLIDGRPVMLKPNLINDSPHPVTTPPEFCEAVIAFVRKHTDAPIVIAEGCGDAVLDTSAVFARLGYAELAKRLDVRLMDLNTAALICLTDHRCKVFPEMWLPEVVFEHVLISLPVLKAHSLARLTGSMKNMMGLAPPEHYGGRNGGWKKSVFHHRLDAAIVELNRYRAPDFTVMDATIGLADYHLGGACCDPPVNRILSGRDARAADREAAGLLGVDWQKIGYLVSGL